MLKYIVAAWLAVAVMSCGRPLVKGYEGYVDAINFIPEDKGNPWHIYITLADGRSLQDLTYHKPNFKVGDYVTEMYTDTGEFVDFKVRKVKHK